MKMKFTASLLLAAVTLTACENPKQAVGTVGGGALGAWAGSTIGKGRGNTVATAAGAVLGALLGGEIGRQLDEKDKMYAGRTTQDALESGRTNRVSEWRNPDSGNSGTIKPIKTYETDGRYCREFVQTIRIGGKVQEAYGTACRQPDGSWQIVSN